MPHKCRKGPARHRPLPDNIAYKKNDIASPRQVWAYEAAVSHLLAHSLTPAPNVPALRVMWKAGPQSRRLAQVIADRWELSS